MMDVNWKKKKIQLRDLASEIDLIKEKIATTEKITADIQAELN
jgi:hypothetical protein